MARAVRKKELTAEERLAAALVPEEEQPYKVPGNWCWVRLEALCSIPITDGTHKTPTYCKEGEGVPFISAKDVTSGKISWEKIKYIPTELHEELYKRLAPQVDDILLAKNGTTGVAAIVDEEKIFDIYVTLAVLRPNKNMILPSYLLNAINSPICKNQFDEHLTGIGVPNLHLRDIKVTSIPLPPRKEQERIVNVVERLFADLDEAKEKLTAVVEGFAQRKAAILHQAFTGELTVKWREETGRKNEWEEVTLDSVCKSIFDGDHQPPPKSEEGIPFLVISNVNTGYLSFDNTRYVTREYYDALSETRKAEEGDVLYTLVGSYGIPVVVDSNKHFCFQRHMALLKPAKINTRFLWYQLQSYEFYNKATEIATGTAQLTVPIKGLRKLTIKTTSDEEQAEVVNTLDSLLFAEQQAQSAVETVLADIDTLKKSILARAFRGELSTNDPKEENAVEMLKKML